jgi:glycerol-3-phosphate O-acyltransferase
MNLFQRYLRWLIMLGVKAEMYPDTKVFNAQLEESQTVYVLADRGLSDLLILSEVCQQHQLPDPFAKNQIPSLSNYRSVYGIASRSPMIDWLKNRSKQSEILDDLIIAVKENPQINLRLVPVSVYWGRPLARQKHWLQVLFADRWAVAGRTRRFFTWMIHSRNTRIILSESVNASKFFETCHYDSSTIHTQLLEVLTQQRQATFGPQITSHKILSNAVLNADSIKQSINQLKQTDSISEQKAHRKAKQYCDEIFANCTQITIKLMLRLLRQFWRRFYSGIDIHNIAPIQEIALTHQLVYVPCHRSHVDYLLLSYVIFNENLAIPYIAAGSNLNVPIIGRILRGGGAFFIRRSFKDNRLYSDIMRQYLQQLVDLDVPLEYFIEGGRSRKGRLLTPKLCMLEMTMAAYIKTQKRPIAFVPVYIGYEKLIEGPSYLGELFGEEKKGESLLGALSAIFRLSGRFGQVTASFGTPIVLSKLLDNHRTDWRSQSVAIDEKPDWYKSAILELSSTIMFSINRACIVNPVNLSALVLLATPKQSIDLAEMVEQANMLSSLITNPAITAAVTVSRRVDPIQINQLADQNVLVVRKHTMGDIVQLTPENAVLMSYYRNNCLHSVILPALLACCFVNSRKLGHLNPFVF